MLSKYASVAGLILVALGALTESVRAQSPLEKARLSRTLWSAFQCATYAEMSGNEKEQARLFDVAVKSGRDFLEAVKSRQIPEDVARQEVPIGVSMLLQGPSTDFIIGRIFENAMSDAYDQIVKYQNGILQESSKWENDKEVTKVKARTKYQTGNCALIK